MKTCQAPLSPVHGEVRDFGVDYSYGNEINYTCNPGFMLKGSDVGRCNENDTWGKVPECVGKQKLCDLRIYVLVHAANKVSVLRSLRLR